MAAPCDQSVRHHDVLRGGGDAVVCPQSLGSEAQSDFHKSAGFPQKLDSFTEWPSSHCSCSEKCELKKEPWEPPLHSDPDC